jgi:proline iminopeptidase
MSNTLTIANSMPIVSLPPVSLLPLDHGHVMAWASVGDVRAPPVLILHGGPGGRSRAASVNWFDGLGLRCIVHDQRGCGASVPAGACDHNDLDTLVADIERLREHLGIAQWAVAGGSWGALLAVAYAARHPARVGALLLRSAFLGSAGEVAHFFGPWDQWLGASGAARLAWPGAPGAGGDGGAGVGTGVAVPDPVRLLDALAARQAPPEHAVRVALAWQAYEQAQAAPGGLPARPDACWAPAAVGGTTSAADAGAGADDGAGAGAGAAAVAGAGAGAASGLPPGLRVQWHYLRHGCFVDDGQREAWLSVLDVALRDRPVSLVHGDADAVCDVEVSRRLAARWPGARLVVVPGAGHDMDHPALRAALVAAAADWSARWRAPVSVAREAVPAIRAPAAADRSKP